MTGSTVLEHSSMHDLLIKTNIYLKLQFLFIHFIVHCGKSECSFRLCKSYEIIYILYVRKHWCKK